MGPDAMSRAARGEAARTLTGWSALASKIRSRYTGRLARRCDRDLVDKAGRFPVEANPIRPGGRK